MGPGFHRDLFGRPGGQDFSAPLPSLWPKINHVIRTLDDVQVMFDDQHGISFFDQPPKQLNEFTDIGKMQPSGRFIEQVEGASGRALGQFSCELDALRFSPGQSRGRLPNL